MKWQARVLAGVICAAWTVAAFSHGALAQDYQMPVNYNVPGTQVYDGPAPVYIPPPPRPFPDIEVGIRYWNSTGKTSFSIDSARSDPSLGSPTSTLNYSGMVGNTMEFTFRAESQRQYFVKGFIGGGWLDGGHLTDRDFYAGQVKFSDTTSDIKGNDLYYGTIDVGKRFNVMTRGPQIDIGPFVGFNYWEEKIAAYGAQCNAVDVSNPPCGAPGTIEIPFGSEAIGNDVHWAAVRIGAQAHIKLFNRVTLMGDAAFLPFAQMWANDSHYYRSDLGKTPNIKDSGTGWGYQLEAGAKIDLTQNWALGAGVRYWYATTNGSSVAPHAIDPNTGAVVKEHAQLHNFTSDRLGVYGSLTYKFWTF